MQRERSSFVLESVGANVRRLRHARGLSQERLAELADLHLTYVQSIERGSRNISVAVLVVLADALNVAPGILLRAARLGPRPRGRPRKKRRSAR